MKLVPPSLQPVSTNISMDRLTLPYTSDLMMRYSSMGFPAFPSSPQQPHAPSIFDMRFPPSIAPDPRQWSRDDVSVFLHWCEREYGLQPIDMKMFQINGKALCILTRIDLTERAPGSGDVLFNTLQILQKESLLHRTLPNSPITPTTRTPFSLNQPVVPHWNIFAQNAGDTAAYNGAAAIAQIFAGNNSVALSPASSNEDQGGNSPKRETNGQPTPQNSAPAAAMYNHSIFGNAVEAHQASDSEDERSSSSSHHNLNTASPPGTPLYSIPINFTVPPKSPLDPAVPRSPAGLSSMPNSASSIDARQQFFPPDMSPTRENVVAISNNSTGPGSVGAGTGGSSGGRLLWDFLINLLNDPNQRFTQHIAWKNKETGVFKICDPSGLARLWGRQKNHLSMNYDKMSRALRYYYKVHILRKVPGERHCYQFLKGPGEMKTIKTVPTHIKHDNFEALSSFRPSAAVVTKQDPVEVRVKFEYDDEQPTDLTMDAPTDLSSNGSNGVKHVNIVCSPDTSHIKDLPYIKEEKP